MRRNTPTPHEEWATQLIALGRGELAGPERAELQAHLADCPRCAAAYQSYQEVAEIIQRLPKLSLSDTPPARYLHLQPNKSSFPASTHEGVISPKRSHEESTQAPLPPQSMPHWESDIRTFRSGRYCNNCGSLCSPGDTRCANCGTPIPATGAVLSASDQFVPPPLRPIWRQGDWHRSKALLASAILLVVVLVFVILVRSKALFINSSVSATNPRTTPSLNASPSPTLPPTPFQFVVSSPQNGQVLQHGVQIPCSGTYSGPRPDYVWVVLKDTLGQYYLQNPPVEFHGDGTWVASNVLPEQGITEIDIVLVTSAGNDLFQQKVSNAEFRAFNQLPDGSTILATVRIQVN